LFADGVGHIANFTTCSKLTVCFRPSTVTPVALIFDGSEQRPPFGVFGVGHEPEPLPDVERADARSAQIRRPDGVVLAFQVSRNTVEPSKSIRARNLFAKDDCRAALANEPEPRRPKMARIGGAIAFPGGREWLTGATPAPDSAVVRPSGKSEGVTPAADAGEEMTLDESSEIVGPNIDN
jgi:hypothetical protein